ncbi:hypothetical protein HBI56_080760 [Parastagonospora nodorum]|uniref:Uncharacterized protein n=1 Tax=Phaeosphaeria nodorum (strain SN15 / ATCC MYA-4574 / FGSC 10173) TaxID=321614 RepID=A0A7U2FJU4_PHANO|nr:hypothetical protein HBH56_105940 [Parastagonospora nodorum]QRD04795.1 hypothetical protein JI435_421720 [Parastagonospora nodorum SN15]KAH3929633.1 hypothetical protein HBH54_124470 [Parastagonospora nodorum]KAH3951348.1 hypothetical protein HBH53_058470 [Parastagonospora nodorum]KAH3975647.1 hypothetical protein HBH52_128400 [Parastagonospora nodorum]
MGKLTMSLDKPINDLKSQYKKSHIIICQTPTSTASVDGSNQMKADGTLPRKKGYIYIYSESHHKSRQACHSSRNSSHHPLIFICLPSTNNLFYTRSRIS